MKKIGLFLLGCLFCGQLFAQDAPRSTSVIIQELRDNYQAMADYNEQLKNLNSDKDITIEELKFKVSDVSENLDKALKEDSEKTETIIKQNEDIKIKNKWLAIISSILGAFFILHVVLLILYFKFGIKLPYMLNTIL